MKMRITSILVLTFALAVCAPAGADTIYTNGPINGISAYGISFSQAVADSFVSAGSATVTGFDAGIWVDNAAYNGDMPATLTWTILTGSPSWSGGTPVASGNATLSNAYWGNYYGHYSIYTSTVSGLNVDIGAGTYWLELSNGLTAHANYLFWDLNDGPSMASVNVGNVGHYTIGSEAFTVYSPLPPSALLLGSGLLGLVGWRKFRKG